MIPKDKLGHAAAGLAWSGVGALIYVVACVVLRIVPAGALPLALFLPPLAAGITKEFADWSDNRSAEAIGQPDPHGVEFMDAFATTLPGIVLSALAVRYMPLIERALS